jgi:hypothetical protein
MLNIKHDCFRYPDNKKKTQHLKPKPVCLHLGGQTCVVDLFAEKPSNFIKINMRSEQFYQNEHALEFRKLER